MSPEPENARRESEWRTITLTGRGLFRILVACTTVVALAFTAGFEATVIIPFTLRYRERMAILMGLIVAAYLLYLLRRRFKTTYGMLEVVFAVLSGWRVLETQEVRDLATVIALAGVVYILVRGFVNIDEGLKSVSLKWKNNGIDGIKFGDDESLPAKLPLRS